MYSRNNPSLCYMIYCFDLDNTLCETIDGRYNFSTPIQEMIDRVNKLYDQGHEIKIYTARGMNRFNKDTNQVKDVFLDFTQNQLKNWGVKYHELHLGKPSYDVFIDDKNLTIDEFKTHHPLKTGFIAGAFDIIHPGYIDMFQFMKEHCDFLTVGLHSDPNFERPNKLKPILSVGERKKILLSLKGIDEVIVYDREKDLVKILEQIKPDVRFLGDDYRNQSFTGDDLNIPILFIDRKHGWSTTKFKTEIYNSIKKSLD